MRFELTAQSYQEIGIVVIHPGESRLGEQSEGRLLALERVPPDPSANPTSGSRWDRRVSGGLNVARPFKAGAGVAGMPSSR